MNSYKSVNREEEKIKLIFPSSLLARQRAALHAVADAHGLPHVSTGEGPSRRIILGPINGRPVEAFDDDFQGSNASNALIIEKVKQYFGVDGTDVFSSLDCAATVKASTVSVPHPKRRVQGLENVSSFINSMMELITLERDAEIEAAQESLASNAARSNNVLSNLRLDGAEGGLLGRTLLVLVRNKVGSLGDNLLPPHKLSPHDIVQLRPAKGGSEVPVLAKGVVYRTTDTSIIVAVDEYEEGMDVPLKLEKLANEVTYDRLHSALQKLSTVVSSGMGSCRGLVDVVFQNRPPRLAPLRDFTQSLNLINKNLDESQKRAVAHALAATDIALIQGPPGTGKTTTVVEIIAQEVLRGSRVLACGASNLAVDNLVERLSAIHLGEKVGRVNVVRVGHPARLLPQVLDSSLEVKVLQNDESALARDCQREIKDINMKLLKLGKRSDRSERNALRKELRQLAKEQRQRQERAITSVLTSASVICATLTGVGVRYVESLSDFDVVVIDEAAQALEPACWAALVRGKRAILAGDHMQLPPTVVSEKAARQGLSVTLFERAHALDTSLSVMLTVQYRMHKDIMTWSSSEFYDDKLVAHPSVEQHVLEDISGFRSEPIIGETGFPVLLLIDTAGCDMAEAENVGEVSKFNEGEARVAMNHVLRLVSAGLKPADIGVITPYAAQVGRLREMRNETEGMTALEISTVDGFQGREKEAIVISMVRSNQRGEVGFLSDTRRMNVAVTRARRHCTIVCDTDTVSSDPFLKRLTDYFMNQGEYMMATEDDV